MARRTWYDRPVPCDPLSDLRAWQQRLERLARHPSDGWAPPIDVYETADAFVVTAEVPGDSREHVELAVEESRLVIQGRRAARPGAGDAVHYPAMGRQSRTELRVRDDGTFFGDGGNRRGREVLDRKSVV